ncbi:TPA: hypothetical protein ACVYPL_004223 [Salmonella enterica]|nr:hypothetical protein [Salmonella enterica]EDN4742995.1 hypothetical protein [Salmonella enterica subsp. enterica serovar Oranienburg]EDS0985613.1 hypothetical protein [Salmonella enterica]EDU1388963.1 hypothetical protein [Salmonella enterica subsp. enterica serovar Oranienburg]EFS4244636.1 hypothetical protein [Salmonella enterica]
MFTQNGYSPCDQYFLKGVDIIQSYLQVKGCVHQFYFVDMRVCCLPAVCPDNLLGQIVRQNTVLICEDKLLPLALFYIKHHTNVVAVYSSRTPIDVLVQSLLKWSPEEQILRIRARSIEILTRTEANILGRFGLGLAGEKAGLKESETKTIYSHERSIARKFGRKKFHNIFG